MKPERPKKQTEEGRWRKVRHDRAARLTCQDFTLGEQVPVVYVESNGHETRGLATIIDINLLGGWFKDGRVYVRFPAIENHVYELDFSRSTHWSFGRREVRLDWTALSG